MNKQLAREVADNYKSKIGVITNEREVIYEACLEMATSMTANHILVPVGHMQTLLTHVSDTVETSTTAYVQVNAMLSAHKGEQE